MTEESDGSKEIDENSSSGLIPKQSQEVPNDQIAQAELQLNQMNLAGSAPKIDIIPTESIVRLKGEKLKHGTIVQFE